MMVPNSIEKLTFLKYLDLSRNNIKVLPNSITRLLNLQTLNLSYCYKLKELPGNIQNLFNLRNLELIGCYNLTHMPPGIGQLTSLQGLPFFIVNEELRLCLVRVKYFPENIYFPEMLFSGKENIFKCLVVF